MNYDTPLSLENRALIIQENLLELDEWKGKDD